MPRRTVGPFIGGATSRATVAVPPNDCNGSEWFRYSSVADFRVGRWGPPPGCGWGSPTNERSMAMTDRGRERVTVVVTVAAEFHPPVAVHPTLGRAKMDEDAETPDWKGEPTDAGEKG